MSAIFVLFLGNNVNELDFVLVFVYIVAITKEIIDMNILDYDISPRDVWLNETEETKTIQDIDHYFEGVLHCLYGDADLNEENLHHCIEEICVLLERKLPTKNLNVKNRVQKKIFIYPLTYLE